MAARDRRTHSALKYICCEILAELKLIRRQQKTVEIHEELTAPLTQGQLATLFNCGRNRVKKDVLSKYRHDVVCRKYRMQVKDMPSDYRQTLSSIREFENRKGTR